MPHFEKEHAVRHAASDMFELVSDIERYPEFVPLCQSLVIRSSREKLGREIILSDMTVGYMAIRETFTCQVVLNKAGNEILASYVDGPFKYLENKWQFEEVGPDSCIVHFKIDYEFKSRTLAMLMGSMFDHAFGRFTQAFEARADEIYGSKAAAG